MMSPSMKTVPWMIKGGGISQSVRWNWKKFVAIEK